MLTRRILTAGLGCSMAAGSALAKSAQVPPTVPVVPPAAADPMLVAGRLDAADRLTVPVRINDKGPFAFVVDTGADRTVMADDLAVQLDLPVGPNVLIHGIGGADLVSTRRVGSLTVGAAQMRDVQLPTLPRERLGVDGLLGVDALQGSNVVMDFRKRKLEIRSPRPRFTRNPHADIIVRAEDRLGRLAVTDARVANIRTTAFIDSGGGVSIGNLALAKALNARRQRGPTGAPVMATLTGTTGRLVTGEVRVVSSLQLGSLRFTHLPIVFVDLYVFEVWGLTKRPTILLGVDVLQLFSRVELDFGAEEVLFRVGGIMPVGQA